jgi:Rad3-related DNA helicase
MKKIRENYKVSLENCVLIFDEAHNIAQAQEEVTSFELRTRLLESSLSEF